MSVKICLILIFLFFKHSFSQNKENSNIIKTEKNSFYMVCRGTSSKIRFITGFNVKDKNITHVGIGILENNKINIYNVNNEYSEIGNLFVQNLEDFVYPADIYYLSIWEYKSTEKEIKHLKNILQTYTKKKISFDMDFNENGKQKLYCSEFCATILNELNRKLFRFKKVKKKLDLMYKKVLERDTVLYFPVDFFETNKEFKKIYEQKY